MSKKSNKKNVFFPNLDYTDAEKEWVGMPEFVQEENKPYREIVVRFTNAVDVEKFAKKIERSITSRTTYIWYSKVSFKGRNVRRRYIDES